MTNKLIFYLLQEQLPACIAHLCFEYFSDLLAWLRFVVSAGECFSVNISVQVSPVSILSQGLNFSRLGFLDAKSQETCSLHKDEITSWNLKEKHLLSWVEDQDVDENVTVPYLAVRGWREKLSVSPHSSAFYDVIVQGYHGFLLEIFCILQ